MIGPVDIADWDYDETDAAKAELRLNPRVQEIACSAASASRRVRALVALLCSGAQMRQSEIDELRLALEARTGRR